MTQEAIVTRVFPGGMAEVAVTRMTACGGSCGSCESCIFQNELKITAKNLINADKGERVIIESRTSTVYKAIFLVYVMPMVLFLAGYAAANSLGAAEGICILASFLGLVAGGYLIVFSQKLKKTKNKFTYDIIGKAKTDND